MQQAAKMAPTAFFPFNQTVSTVVASRYNYGFGAKLQFDFTLTSDGQVVVGKDASGKDIEVPIKFFFSGDDDVWVYIDGKLVLDVGGAHGKASGLLEFGASSTVTPTSVPTRTPTQATPWSTRLIPPKPSASTRPCHVHQDDRQSHPIRQRPHHPHPDYVLYGARYVGVQHGGGVQLPRQ